MTRTRRTGGLSLLEVLLAIAVIGIGVLTLTRVHTGALQASLQAERIAETTRLVRNELEWQRHAALQPTSTDCLTDLPDVVSDCRVDIAPCTFDADAGTLTCGGGTAPNAYRIAVTATRADGATQSLSALWTGNVLTGTPP
ncbi:MAG: hypothetical protein RI554_06590 [Trueperaceae bacterium]|nr:hypothetical protein [Trueperaceae bacterium]